MGGVFNKIVGGSKSTAENQGFDFLKDQFSGTTQAGSQANNVLASLLGIGGDPSVGQNAFKTFQDSTGFDFELDQGSNAITNNNAAKGLLKSGATLKSLTQFDRGLRSGSFRDFLGQLTGLAGQGLQAGGLISGAGQKSVSKQSDGVGGLIGSAAGAFLSDHRAKKNREALSNPTERLKALKPCRFEYQNSTYGPVDGFYAHEAAEVVPEAVVGEKDAVDENGKPIYQTIDHSRLVPLLTAALQEALQRIEALEKAQSQKRAA